MIVSPTEVCITHANHLAIVAAIGRGNLEIVVLFDGRIENGFPSFGG